MSLGYDPSPPRNNIIFAVGVGAAVFLLTLVPLFRSYFVHMSDAEHRAKSIVDNSASRAIEDQQEKMLNSGPVPIERAIRTLATRGRNQQGIRPKANDTVDAILGWSGRPHEAEAEAARQAIAARRAREQALREAAAAAIESGEAVTP